MQCASAVTFIALGGYTLLAPAGTKVIDSFLSKLGGDLIETYGKAVKFTPINLEVNAFKSEVHGIKVDFGAVFNKKAGVGLKKLGAQLLNCDSALLQKTGVTLAKAGAFLIG
jgi:type VI secretion system secreted protein VgrG